MASPSRLLRTKHSSPLPSQLKPFTSLSCNNLANLKEADEIPRPRSAYPVVYPISSNELSATSVKDYLRYHKSFLEDFLLQEIPVAVLQKILKRKTSTRESGFEVASVVGTAINKLKKFSPKSQIMMGILSGKVQKGLPFKTILYHLCKSTAEAAYADNFQFYMVQANHLVFVEGEALIPEGLRFPIRLGDTIPGYVAATKLLVNINIIKQKSDFKFPKGSSLTQQDLTMAFILCVPILKKNGEVIGVLELGRRLKEPKFSEDDEQTVQSYLSWATVAMDCSNIHYENVQYHLLFDAYSKITRLNIGGEWSFESIFECIQSTVITIVNSENAKIFMLSRTGKDLCLQLPSSNLYDKLMSSDSSEAVFIEDSSKQNILSQSDIVFPGLSIIKRVADYVVKTGEVLNLNETSRKKFLEQDSESSVAAENCRTLLCAPLKVDEEILGVIVAVNKNKNEEFSAQDKEHFTSFCEFCSLVISKCQIQKELGRLRVKSTVTKGVLEYHRVYKEEDFVEVKSKPAITIDTFPIREYSFDSGSLGASIKAQLAVTLFFDLVGTSDCFDRDKMLKFCLTTSKNYRPVSYHNWEHAFSVAHCMYWVITGAPTMFTELEKVSLFVACLCHDLDHRGTNSAFLSKTGSPLAKLYCNPIIENHHFNQALTLLQIDEINIFSNYTEQEYFKALAIIRQAIMASDIMQFFKNRDAMVKLRKEGGHFSWENPAHKEVALRMLITVCDLNSTYKPWSVYNSQVEILFEEFYEQGDCEKMLGFNPIEIMDRNYQHKIPEIQIHFIGTFSLSSCQLLEPILPKIKILREGAETNIKKWKAVIEEKNSNEKNSKEQEANEQAEKNSEQAEKNSKEQEANEQAEKNSELVDKN